MNIPRKEDMVVGIVGGKGRMGSWFFRFLTDAGYRVMVSDKDTELFPTDLALRCHVVIVSVPMEAFSQVIGQIGPLISKDAFLTDLCSLKAVQVQEMLRNTVCSVAGSHPLFGPAENSIKGRRMALCPGRGDEWFAWWRSLLESSGAHVYCTEAVSHDRTMAWVQALNHFILISLGKAVFDQGLNMEELISLSTPSFSKQMEIVARLFYQDPQLYATIQMSNPFAMDVLNSFRGACDKLYEAVMTSDRDTFVEVFKGAQFAGKTYLDTLLGHV
ncbi:MAG: prephenate dehydrogenase/arogenate dehydrogenase family protein [Dissulfuribacterales bacterium]